MIKMCRTDLQIYMNTTCQSILKNINDEKQVRLLFLPDKLEIEKCYLYNV